jgi:hypothetical protein
MNTSRSEPKIGDVVGCTDGDIGIVLSTTVGDSPGDGDFMVEVAWNSGRVLTDSWCSEDFSDGLSLFRIMSRA